MCLTNKTQSNIVIDLGITASTVSDWVNAKKYPRIDRMQALAEYLGVVISDLRDDKKNENTIMVTGMVPIIGVITAGVPILAEKNIEGYLPTMLKNSDEYFYLRVHGESMINAGIKNGALVLVHQQSTADNDDIVACRLNDDEATLKRFNQTGDMIILSPENSEFRPIVVSCKQFNEGYAEIIGVAKQVTSDL